MASSNVTGGSILNQSMLIAAGGLLWLSMVAIYRLYFHPLSKFPGPKLAALTTWYNAYYDVVAGGQYIFKIEDMHKRYGPIVRVRPDALHVNDPNFIDKLYSQSPKQRREKYWTVTRALLAPGSILATEDHDLHRRRRAVLNPYFSKQNVRRLDPIIMDTLASLFRRMSRWAKEGVPVKIAMPYRAATKDIIQSYAFGEGDKYLDMEDCNTPFFEIMEPCRVNYFGTHIYWLAWTLANIPPSIMTVLVPRVGVFANYVKGLNEQIDRIRKEKQNPDGRKTIFHEILQSNMPDEEKKTRRLADEAMIIVIAGSETTATTLAALTYHLLAEPKLLARLKAELQSVMPNPNKLPDTAILESLPYMNALINEALRMYPGATHRQDRVAPDENLVYKGPNGMEHVIPAGSAVGMAAPLINRNEDFYERPHDFWPDRYLKDPTLSKYMLSFSRGARQCIGINLAYQELQIFTAGIFRRYDIYNPSKAEQDGPTLELYNTRLEDISMVAEYISPVPYAGSQGVRVIIRE